MVYDVRSCNTCANYKAIEKPRFLGLFEDEAVIKSIIARPGETALKVSTDKSWALYQFRSDKFGWERLFGSRKNAELKGMIMLQYQMDIKGLNDLYVGWLRAHDCYSEDKDCRKCVHFKGLQERCEKGDLSCEMIWYACEDWAPKEVEE